MSIKIDDVTMGVVSHRCIKKNVKPCYYRNQKQSCMDSLCAMRHKEDGGSCEGDVHKVYL